MRIYTDIISLLTHSIILLRLNFEIKGKKMVTAKVTAKWIKINTLRKKLVQSSRTSSKSGHSTWRTSPPHQRHAAQIQSHVCSKGYFGCELSLYFQGKSTSPFVYSANIHLMKLRFLHRNSQCLAVHWPAFSNAVTSPVRRIAGLCGSSAELGLH